MANGRLGVLTVRHWPPPAQRRIGAGGHPDGRLRAAAQQTSTLAPAAEDAAKSSGRLRHGRGCGVWRLRTIWF